MHNGILRPPAQKMLDYGACGRSVHEEGSPLGLAIALWVVYGFAKGDMVITPRERDKLCPLARHFLFQMPLPKAKPFGRRLTTRSFRRL